MGAWPVQPLVNVAQIPLRVAVKLRSTIVAFRTSNSLYSLRTLLGGRRKTDFLPKEVCDDGERDITGAMI